MFKKKPALKFKCTYIYIQLHILYIYIYSFQLISRFVLGIVDWGCSSFSREACHTETEVSGVYQSNSQKTIIKPQSSHVCPILFSLYSLYTNCKRKQALRAPENRPGPKRKSDIATINLQGRAVSFREDIKKQGTSIHCWSAKGLWLQDFGL